MKITWKDLTVDFSRSDFNSLVENWTWLIGDNMTPVMISSIGDMFVSDLKGKIYWLDVGLGELKEVASDFEELELKMKDDGIANEWFMFSLVRELKEGGQELNEGQLYSYKKLPIIGGEYNLDNFEIREIEEHFSTTGQIHKSIKDLPDGTKVRIEKK